MPRFMSFLIKSAKVITLVTLPFLCMFVGAFATMLIAIRGTDVVVPNVVGADKMKALQLLDKAKLRGDAGEARYSLTVPHGRIISQAPAAGSAAKANSLVRIVVSEGKKRLPVPSLLGLPLAQANLVLQQSGMRCSHIAYVQLLDGGGEEILDQNPAAGSPSNDSMSVSVLVNVPRETASTFIMPEVIGLNGALTRDFFVRQRFSAVLEEESSLFSGSSGEIYSQYPSPGTTITRQTSIILRSR